MCGIDSRTVIHSLRHRAQGRLRAAGAPPDIREAVLGHSKLTVGEGDGVGFPTPMKWSRKPHGRLAERRRRKIVPQNVTAFGNHTHLTGWNR
jgi:hypothetical protein